MRGKEQTVKKQTGKKTAAVVAGPVGNATPTMTKYKDTEFYQVDRHGDYVQQAGG